MQEFDELRATQAAAVVVTVFGCGAARPRWHYRTVLKLLIVADLTREKPLLWREVPVGYQPTTIPHAWDRFFEVDGEDLVLVADPDVTELTDDDVETLAYLCRFINEATEQRAKLVDAVNTERWELGRRMLDAQTKNAELFLRQLKESQAENDRLRQENDELKRGLERNIQA